MCGACVYHSYVLWDMEDLNELSNEELQYRLAQFGAPNIPVTSTTRKILIKRLRNLIENEKSKLRRDTEYATRYSSDEDVSSIANDTKGPAKAAKGRSRSTISVNTRLGNRSNLNMPPPLSTTVQKPSTSLWIDKSQVCLLISRFIKRWREKKKIYQLINLLLLDNKKITDKFNLHITINSTWHRWGIRPKWFAEHIIFKSIQKQFHRHSVNLKYICCCFFLLLPSRSNFDLYVRFDFNFGFAWNFYRTSSIFNGHDVHDSSSISKSRYSNDTAENSSHSTNALNASTDGSTNGDNDDDLSSPYSSTNFTKRLLSLRNRSLGSTHNAPTMLDTSKWIECAFLLSIEY